MFLGVFTFVQLTVLSTHQDRQQQCHVAPAEYGEEDGVHHEVDIGGGQWREQVDHATKDQVGLVVVVLMEIVTVCQPA